MLQRVIEQTIHPSFKNKVQKVKNTMAEITKNLNILSDIIVKNNIHCNGNGGNGNGNSNTNKEESHIARGVL